MNLNELVKLSLKAIKTNKLRSFLTTLGITIGVFSIIVLVSIGSGLQTYITHEISSLGPNVIFVIPGSGNGLGAIISNKLKLQDSKNLQRKLIATAKLTPEIRSLDTLKYQKYTSKNAIIEGVSSDAETVLSSFKVAKGHFFTAGQEKSGANVVIIGQTVEKNLFKNVNSIGKRVLVGTRQYTVIGVFDKIGTFAGVDGDNIIEIPVEAASAQYGTNTVSRIDISANNTALIPIVIKQINQTLQKRLTKDDYSIQTADSVLSTVSSITNVLSLALGGIAAISLLVGGIGVANIMLVSVTERTKEIGLRKALGAKRSDILKQFLLESVMISVLGGVIGIVLGMVASFIIAFVLVSTVTTWSIFIAFGFSVFVGIIFGVAPALRASKLNPIDALRYE